MEMQLLESRCHQHPLPLDAIGGHLAKLVGAMRDYMRIFGWNFNASLLAKLKAYCALFLQNADTEEKELIALQHYVEKVWQAGIQALDALRAEPYDRSSMIAAVDKGAKAMNRLSKLIARLFLQFRDDENVVFCFLQHHELLDKLYGPRFCAKLLCRLYPKGLKEAKHMLTCRYTVRGFDHLIPIIDAKISALETSLV